MTLWCLNGLKSSLTCTGGDFLITRVPKKGFGGPWGETFSDCACFPFEEGDDVAPLAGLGDAPYTQRYQP